jgi:hypothetical protein
MGHKIQSRKFSEMSALNLFNKRKKAGLPIQILSPVFKFIKMYFINFGFLDGTEGFIIARISSKAVYIKYAELRKLYKAEKN